MPAPKKRFHGRYIHTQLKLHGNVCVYGTVSFEPLSFWAVHHMCNIQWNWSKVAIGSDKALIKILYPIRLQPYTGVEISHMGSFWFPGLVVFLWFQAVQYSEI